MGLVARITGKGTLLATLALLAAALLAPAAHAANFTVNTLADGNDASTGDGICQVSPGGPCTFRAAVEEADATSADDSIGFSVTGVHPITLGAVSTGVSGGGNLTITGKGEGGSGTVLDGTGGVGSFVILANNTGSQTVSLSSLQVRGLNAAGGAGIRSNGGTLTLSRIVSTANTGGSGAGVSASAGVLNVSDSTVSGNTDTSGSPGGGISASSAVLNLTRSAITGNSAPSGGAAIFTSGPGSSISNTTITANTAPSGVGVIRNDTNTLTIRNSTIAGNTAAAANSALASLGGTMNVGNSIVASAGVACQASGGTIVSAGNNVATDGTCTPGPTDKPSTNPQLAALLDNGGPTQTMAIYESSPALNAGSAALCAASPVNNVDQRSVARPQLSGCDIGAFEYAPYIAPKPTRPDNSFKLGKLKLKQNGTAILPVTVPGPGLVSGTDLKKMKKRKLVKPARVRPKAAATVRLKLKPTAQAKLQLFLLGKVKTKLKVSFTPTGGSTNSKRVAVKLAEK
jgi:CSLREA domain-containing protein